MAEPQVLHTVTPLLHSLPLSRVAGSAVHLKLEALQPVGSFKIRGIGRLCVQAAAAGTRHFVSSSGGNAGVAVAYAGRQLGIRTTVYVFAGMPEAARQRMEEFGAEVVMAGPGWEQAHQAASAVAENEGAFYVHPFDHPEIWAGHSTLVDEVVASGLRPQRVIVSVGGGGLIAGVLQGLARHGLHQTEVLAVETHGTASMHAALTAGKLVRIDKIDSIAKTLGANQVAAGAFELAQAWGVRPVLVSDAQALGACRRFALDHRLLVEPAAGAALAVAYDGLGPAKPAGETLVVVCGGVGIALRDEIFAYGAPA